MSATSILIISAFDAEYNFLTTVDQELFVIDPHRTKKSIVLNELSRDRLEKKNHKIHFIVAVKPTTHDNKFMHPTFLYFIVFSIFQYNAKRTKAFFFGGKCIG